MPPSYVVLGTFVALCAIYYRVYFLEPVVEKSSHKYVTLYRNGESSGGVHVTVVPSDVPSTLAFALYLSQTYLKPLVYDSTTQNDREVLADRVYDGQGELMSNYAQVGNHSRLYVVAPGLLFVWPFVKLGHRVVLPSSHSKEPLVLESFTSSPRTFRVHHFFTPSEAQVLIERILSIDTEHEKLQASNVGHRLGDRVKSTRRTSENAFDTSSSISMLMQKRSFDLLAIGPYQRDMADGLQLLRYQAKQAYIPHTDYFALDTSPDFNWDPANNGSNRFATIFLYLSDVEQGGQTVFPLGEIPSDAKPEYQHPAPEELLSKDEITDLFTPEIWEHEMVEKCQTKLAMYPKEAHAILFYSQTGTGALDPKSLHGGCPVIRGTKWGANLWVWNKRRFGLTPDESGIGSSDKPKDEHLNAMFINAYQQSVSLYWQDTFMMTLETDTRMSYQTFHGHQWQVKDPETNEILWTHIIDKAGGPNQELGFPVVEM